MNRQRPRRGGARRPGTGIAEPIPHNERLRRHGTSLSAANAALGLSRPPPRIIAFEDGLAYIATLPPDLDPRCSGRELRIPRHFRVRPACAEMSKSRKQRRKPAQDRAHSLSTKVLILLNNVYNPSA